MTLSLRLLRKGTPIDEAVRRSGDLREVPAEGARLFVEQSGPSEPDWLPLVTGYAIAPVGRLENKACGAVLFLDLLEHEGASTNRTIAVSFGTAFHSLDPNAFERSLGPRVTLNSTPRSNLRNLDIATLDATVMQKRIQATRNSDLHTFGVDVQRDLLRLAGGVPSDRSFASSMSGKDALTIHARGSRDDIIRKCEAALKLWSEKHYLKDYGWVDYVSPVREQDQVIVLDTLAFAELAGLVQGQPVTARDT